MAVIKYPNYLEELLTLKLKENDFDYESKNVSPKHEKFKFSNVSEENLNLAIQLARKDLNEGNIGHKYNKMKSKSTSLSSRYEINSDDDDDDDSINTQQNSKYAHSDKTRTAISQNKVPPVRTISPPTRDENTKPLKRVKIISEREASLEISRLKSDVIKLIHQIHILASVDTGTKDSESDNPSDVDRRKTRVCERSNRINRLTYDLSRGTKDLLNNIKKGGKQECLKKLLHTYKECVKILKMIAMQMSDSSDPPSFLKSRIFPDLASVLSDLSLSAVDLNVEQQLESNADEPFVQLKQILDTYSAGLKKRVNFPSIPQPSPATPSSSCFNQEFDNNFLHHLTNHPSLAISRSTLESKTPSSCDIEVLKDQINKVQSSRVTGFDPDSRKQLLNQLLSILMQRGLQNDGNMKTEKWNDKDNSNKKMHAGPIRTNNSGLIKTKPRGDRVDTRRTPTTRVQPISFNHHHKDKDTKTSDSNKCQCKAQQKTEGMIGRSKSSPPGSLKKTNDCNNYDNSSGSDRGRKNKPGMSRVIREGRAMTRSSTRRSKSLSREAVCPNCGTQFDDRLQDSGKVEIVNWNTSSSYHGDSKVDIPDDDDDGRSDCLSEVFSTPTRMGIRGMSKRLNQIETDRLRVKERLRFEYGGSQTRDSSIHEIQESSDKTWLENFKNEFRKEVATAKNAFLLRGNETNDDKLSDEFSLRLLQDWERRDREFFSFNMFAGETGNSGDTPLTCETHKDTIHKHRAGAHPPNDATIEHVGDDNDIDKDGVCLDSRITNITKHHGPINLNVNREVLSELVIQNGELKNQVKEGIMRLLDSNDQDENHAFLSSRMAKDILRDCLHEVCNEADFVSDEIVNRVYKSELSANRSA